MAENNPFELTQNEPESKGLTAKSAPSTRALRHTEFPTQIPERIGRYAIESLLGKGGFGVVYLAYDEHLQRRVAIKVPHDNLIARPEDAEVYLIEARTVAKLDHPGIVPVHDVGSTDEFPYYIVSKYIEGTDLATKLTEQPFDHKRAAKLVSTVAEALHHAHKQGLVHRDIKPGNILVDMDGEPHVVDFGLALREENVGQGPKYVGTPAYMSPEQARVEGHRVDGRSDIYSLGAVFYELLTGRRTFTGASSKEILAQIACQEPRPPRQIDDSIPPELERICLKALSKRASERYTTALDLADDLNAWMRADSFGSVTASAAQMQTVSDPERSRDDLGDFDSDGRLIRIVPKGLRSFDAHDADFFLELLPGPRDRDGLPDSLRFWKTRIEETDPENTFSVGLIYGPSGCGKSSLVKAGLLPRLSDHVIPVYIEATRYETEIRLLHRLRKRFADIDNDLSLKETLAALRCGQGIPAGQKVLIVLDQFEQWLHANKEEENTELVQALRQCDGGRIQCVLMVRDEFWLAVSRILRELEVRIVEGHNLALADLFDVDHARKVLAAFGRAFGKLPELTSETSVEQNEFLAQSVAGLADDGKVICVRLALFAEMMKGKVWTPATLKQVGGTKGIGVTFLEETFSSPAASPEHRYHQKAARAVLNDLLPDSGTDIKGYMRSYTELLEVSGYGNRRQEFDDLIRILDSEIRLITPTDPEGKDSDDESVMHTQAGQQYYQLTHDYLVHSLRDWLTRKQKGTSRGRAELRLFDRSATWNAKPENRLLPSWWENLNIRLFTNKKNWTASQRKMMDKARRVQGIRSALVAAFLLAVVFAGITIRNSVEQRQHGLVAQKEEERNDAEATRLVQGLLQADTTQVKTILESLTNYRTWASDDLSTAFASSPDQSNAKLHAALAMLAEEPSVMRFLKERLLTVSPVQFEHVRNLLEEYKSDLIADYGQIAIDPQQDADRRFRAACVLASYDPDNDIWQNHDFDRFVAGHLVTVLPSAFLPWLDALRPVKKHLSESLAAIYRDGNKDVQVRSFATDTLADYLSDDADELFALLADADQKQFATISEKLAPHRERAVALGNLEVSKSPAVSASEDEKEVLAMRQANVAVMLLRMNAAQQVWPLLKHSPDPRLRSYIIHWFSPRGGDPNTIVSRGQREPDVTIKRALLLCLGEFDAGELSESQRTQRIETLLNTYRSDPDPGLHAAAEWLLRRWGQPAQIAAIDQELQQNEAQFLAHQDQQRQWYINDQGQTFMIIDGGEFAMGSPETEAGRNTNENVHQRRVGRRFAMAKTEVTKAQWRKFADAVNAWPADQQHLDGFIRTEDSPMVAMTWYEAAHYCNWLSEQEGIAEDQWCYEKNEQQQYGPGMKAKDNFWELTGYRLPTEAEWEFACRAGANTSRYYGQTASLLPRYAWYQSESDDHAWPVANLKPNDFGLFDMLGNVYEWCYDPYVPYPSDSNEAGADLPTTREVAAGRRVFRGGAFSSLPSLSRSAQPIDNQPDYRSNSLGIRVARTCP